jgi:hypothetical protein
MTELFQDRVPLVGSNAHKRRLPTVYTDDAVALLLGAWCAVAETGDRALVPSPAVPTEAQILAAGPKLVELLVGLVPGTAILKCAAGDRNLEHFIACAFLVLEPRAFRTLLASIVSACSAGDRRRVREHTTWVLRELDESA